MLYRIVLWYIFYMTVTLSKELEKEVSAVARKYGYDSEKSFIEDALKKRILLLKKNNLKELLRERAVVRAEHDLAMAEDWFPLENEA